MGSTTRGVALNSTLIVVAQSTQAIAVGAIALFLPLIRAELDLSFSQEIPGLRAGHKGEIRLDIFNFLNLLNSKWGVEYRASFPLYRYLADVSGVCTAVSAVCTSNDIGKYIYDISNTGRYGAAGTYAPASLSPNESFNPSQRWSMRVTLRYKF